MEAKGIKFLTGESGQSVDGNQCIICQGCASQILTGTANGRKRIRDAAIIRNDIVAKRLKCLDNENVYYMNNECHKKYT
jgi:hypothetical protein